VNDDDKKHTNHVLEECAKKVCKDMTSNWLSEMPLNLIGLWTDSTSV
jgi:hypothetical protein